MTGYIVFSHEVRDQPTYETYRAASDQSLLPYGGRRLADTENIVELETGPFRPTRVEVLEFDSIEMAREWYSSPAYQEAARIRARCASSKALCARGLSQ